MPVMDKKSLSYVLELDRIIKQYPGVLALNNVSLRLRPGEVLAVCGENGAGKINSDKLYFRGYRSRVG